jgi:hypothetical protein
VWGPRVGLDAVDKRKFCFLSRELYSPSSGAEVMWRYASTKTQCFLNIIYIHFRLQETGAWGYNNDYEPA